MKSYIRRIVMFYCIVLIVLMSQDLLAAEEYSLEDLYRIALKRSEQVGISEQNVVIAKKGKEKALSYLLPGISVFGK